MVRIAVSGHRGLPAATQRLVDQAIRAALASQHEVTGLSCLADGADQIFARALLTDLLSRSRVSGELREMAARVGVAA